MDHEVLHRFDGVVHMGQVPPQRVHELCPPALFGELRGVCLGDARHRRKPVEELLKTLAPLGSRLITPHLKQEPIGSEREREVLGVVLQDREQRSCRSLGLVCPGRDSHEDADRMLARSKEAIALPIGAQITANLL